MRRTTIEDRAVEDEDFGSYDGKRNEEKETPSASSDALDPKEEDADSACEDDLSDNETNGKEEVSIEKSLPTGMMLHLPPRIRNLLVRGISGGCLVSGFTLMVVMGPAGLILLTYAVAAKSYSEVMNLGLRRCHIEEGKIKYFFWYLFLLLNLHLDGKFGLKIILDSLVPLSGNSPYVDGFASLLSLFFKQHSTVIFIAYFSGIVWFVSSMNAGNCLSRYAAFAWSHTSLFVLVIPSHLLLLAIVEGGMIFMVLPMIVITINDVAAFYIGFWFGKTPLIKLSPKKTVEGYVGGGIVTVLLGTLFTAFCLRFQPFLTCPVQVNPGSLTTAINGMLRLVQGLESDSTDSPLFAVTQCVPAKAFVSSSVRIMSTEWTVSPFLGHGFLISVFAAVFGPFGGFFASGLKRACSKKNFGSLIPGHGGVVDRCDCMFLMAAFIYVYFDVLKQTGQLKPSSV